MRTRQQRGFTLIELMIVVAIILLIAAIAVPNLMKSRRAANEASAVSSIKNINTAQIGYSATFGIGFADDITKLGMSTDGSVSANHGGYLDWVLACAAQPCLKSGYNFSITDTDGPPVTNFRALGVPADPGVTGQRSFCSNQLSEMTFDPDGGTNCTQPLR